MSWKTRRIEKKLLILRGKRDGIFDTYKQLSRQLSGVESFTIPGHIINKLIELNQEIQILERQIGKG